MGAADDVDGRGRVRRILIANRGEIALRILRSAALFPLSKHQPYADVRFLPLVIHTAAESHAAHVLAVPAKQRILLPGIGPRAYLDVATLIKLGKQHEAWGVAPGYGFLSESAEFAKSVEEAGMVWIGPESGTLDLFSNKVRAKELALQCQVPTLQGTRGESASLEEILTYAQRAPTSSKIIIKAVAGGGGRGMRMIDLKTASETDIRTSFHTCVREAEMSFGDGRVYAERFLEQARHIEVQIVGDGSGDVAHLWERECSLQRKHQKLVEIAPSPTLASDPSARDNILQAALRMASKGKYRSLGTFEFLYVESSNEFFFMEANPRIQVEHTITEQITSLDLVILQLLVALGASLQQLGLGRHHAPLPFPTSSSIQFRINAESMQQDGSVAPASGVLSTFYTPNGPGIRIDTSAHPPLHRGTLKYRHDPSFDSLLAKVIFTAPTYYSAVQMAGKGLKEMQIDGVKSNLLFQRALLSSQEVQTNDGIHTRFMEENLQTILQYVKKLESEIDAVGTEEVEVASQMDGKAVPEGMQSVEVPMAGVLLEVMIQEGDTVQFGQPIVLLESMKMEHTIRATHSGKVTQLLVTKGDPIAAGQPLLFLQPNEAAEGSEESPTTLADEEEDVNIIREDLALVLERKHYLSDSYRKKAVEKRRAAGFLTGRENVALLVDEGSFLEFGDFAVAAQRTRIDEEKLQETTSGDGVITGWATVNKSQFSRDSSDRVASHLSSPARCALVIYDYMVLAGTQGHFHHLKLDRIFRSVLDNPAPMIIYAEGGGGRPGDIDLEVTKVSMLDTPSFALLALVKSRGYPTIGLANGYTFAGNAAILGTCDIVVATQGGNRQGDGKGAPTSTGMGGPAMIEGGGLGVVKPGDVGKVAMHESNGGYDIVVRDEREASQTIKRLVSFFQGPLPPSQWRFTKDSKMMRRLLPRHRARAYDVRTVIDTLCDDDSFLEFNKAWGQSLIVGLGRVQGEAIGILASSVLSPLGGAIDAASSQKAIRFLKMLQRTQVAHLCVLCDTPGFMVGPQAEKEGGLRIFAEFFEAVTSFQDGQEGGRIFAITLRKGYGLGAEALLGGSTLFNFSSAAWPQAEFAAMGIEGAVRLGMKKELEAVEDINERKELFSSFVDLMYQRGKAVNMASKGEIDTIIDPMDTRSWLINGLRSVRPRIPTWQQPRRGHSSRL